MPPFAPAWAAPRGAAAALERACFSIGIDRDALRAALQAQLGDAELLRLLRERCPHVFSSPPVLVASSLLQRMSEVVQAVASVMTLPGWREHALAAAPPIARHPFRNAGDVFLGHDFHLNGEALGLVEIHTGAGGALLAALAARAQRACCRPLAPLRPDSRDIEDFEVSVIGMFRREWQAGGGARPLRTLALVAQVPEEQDLYPEFLLLRQLCERHGLEVLIADPGALALRDGALRHEGRAIDLVYNRLSDFYLEGERCAALREACLQEAVVLAPHPQAHALHADLRRLADLGDMALLASLGVPQSTRELLQRELPRTVRVSAAQAEALWAGRQRLIFKPVSGFGGRAAYRGDKLTPPVWQQILAGDYVAQALVAPPERRSGAPEPRALKFDLRNYVHGGRVQWVAARMYQGQTTSFRHQGGGFGAAYSTTAHGTAAGESAAAPAGAAQPGHASCVFLLDESGEVHPLPHALYVALARAEGASATLAGRSFRLADWYVRLRDGVPDQLVNEWYGWVRFDAQGRFEPAPQGARAPQAGGARRGEVDPSALPTPEERERLVALLFGPASPP